VTRPRRRAAGAALGAIAALAAFAARLAEDDRQRLRGNVDRGAGYFGTA
jgi:hypothetical protein